MPDLFHRARLSPSMTEPRRGGRRFYDIVEETEDAPGMVRIACRHQTSAGPTARSLLTEDDSEHLVALEDVPWLVEALTALMAAKGMAAPPTGMEGRLVEALLSVDEAIVAAVALMDYDIDWQETRESLEVASKTIGRLAEHAAKVAAPPGRRDGACHRDCPHQGAQGAVK